MLVAGLLYVYISEYIPINILFGSVGISSLIGAFFLLFIPSVSHKKDEEKESFSPDYKELFRDSVRTLKNNKQLLKLSTFTVLMTVSAYFVIWLYQELLKLQAVPLSNFGFYRALLQLSSILMSYLIVKFMNKLSEPYQLWLKVLISILIGASFFNVFVFRNLLSVFVFIFIAGGLGLQVRTIFSKEINDMVDSYQRATVLSAISMLRRIILVIFNPFIGFITDRYSVYWALFILGFLSILAGVIVMSSRDIENARMC